MDIERQLPIDRPQISNDLKKHGLNRELFQSGSEPARITAMKN